MSFLLSIFSFFTIFSVQVEWINHILDVPVFENISNYKEMPEANLYINNVLVNDPFIYYERDGVDHTFFSVITTSHVETFTVRYRVHFPTYEVVHTQDIVFNIVDISPPIIIQVPSFRIPLNQSMPDLLQGLVIDDNYNAIEDLTVFVDSYEVLLDQTGIYIVYYQVTDMSGNIAEASTILEVYDVLAPVITIKKETILSYGDIFNWRDFFTVTDNDDPYPYVYIDESNVDYDLLGMYELTIYATDKNGLVSQMLFYLSIIDQEKPIIIFRSQPLPIPVFSNESDINFLSYILSVYDNYSDLSIEDVTCTHDIEFDILGSYHVYFTLVDQSGNIGEYTLIVTVIDNEMPVINILIPLVFDVYDTKPFLIDYIDYFDNYTPYNLLTLKMIESVNMDKIGLYPFVIEVTDKSSNKAILRTYIQIIDRVPPQINQLNDIMITDFSWKDITYYFEATDNYDQTNDIEIEVDDSAVNYESIGSYLIIIQAFDMSGNIGVLTSEIIIVDILDPEIELNKDSLTIEVFSNPINFTSYILEVSDNYDSLSIEDIVIDEHVDYSQIGKYPVSFQLTDSSMNQTIKILNVIVDDMTPPSIRSVPVTLKVGEYYDPLLGITIEDNLDDIEIKWFPQILDTSSPGVKIISYVVSDGRGNYTTFDREITVEFVQETFDITRYLPVILITCLGLGAGFYFYKQLR